MTASSTHKEKVDWHPDAKAEYIRGETELETEGDQG